MNDTSEKLTQEHSTKQKNNFMHHPIDRALTINTKYERTNSCIVNYTGTLRKSTTNNYEKALSK